MIISSPKIEKHQIYNKRLFEDTRDYNRRSTGTEQQDEFQNPFLMAC